MYKTNKICAFCDKIYISLVDEVHLNMINSNFKKLKKECFDILDNNKHIVLATSYNNLVTARTISYVMINEKLYFQTLKTYEKVNQINHNNRVALCIDNLQIEGLAKIVGHPFDNNNLFLELYKEKHNSAYKKYSSLADEVVIEIIINKISRWNYIDNVGHKEIIDLIREEYKDEK